MDNTLSTLTTAPSSEGDHEFDLLFTSSQEIKSNDFFEFFENRPYYTVDRENMIVLYVNPYTSVQFSFQHNTSATEKELEESLEEMDLKESKGILFSLPLGQPSITCFEASLEIEDLCRNFDLLCFDMQDDFAKVKKKEEAQSYG